MQRALKAEEGKFSSPPTETRRSYFPELDGLRAVAVLMVMTFHLAGPSVAIPGPVILGQSGVDLFFVLSGFLITGILLKARPRDWRAVRTFYLRRALRIQPLYYFVLLAVWTGLLHDHVSWDVWLFLQNVTLTFGLPMRGPLHFWSLAVEEQFYLLWPFMVLFLPRRLLNLVLGFTIATAVLCRLPLLHAGVSVFFLTVTRMDALAAGAALAVAQSRGPLAQHRRALLLLLVSSATVLAAGHLLSRSLPVLVQTVKYSAFAAFYTSVVGLVLIARRGTGFLRSRPLRFVGRISYGLYVYHPFVFALLLPVRLLWMPTALRAVLAVATTFAVALLSWYGMERPLIALKDRIAPERAGLPDETPSLRSL